MKRGWKIALGCLAVCVVALALGIWALWAALGHGAVVYQALGDMAMSSGNEKRAAHYYERASKRRPDDASLHLRRAEALAEASKETAALKEYQEAARLEPDDLDALLGQARLHLKAEDLEAAAEVLEKAKEAAPGSAIMHLEYARLRVAREQYDEAIAEFEKALELDAKPGDVCFELGQAYEDTGQPQAAVKAYRRGARACDRRCHERLAELEEPSEEDEEVRAAVPSPSTEREIEEMEAAGAVFMGVFMLAYFAFIAFMMLFTLASWVVSALAIWDCAGRDFPHPNTRAIWCLLIFMTRWVGALIYYIVVYRTDDPPHQRLRG